MGAKNKKRTRPTTKEQRDESVWFKTRAEKPLDLEKGGDGKRWWLPRPAWIPWLITLGFGCYAAYVNNQMSSTANLPYLAYMQSVIGPTTDLRPPGAPPMLQTYVMFQNNGKTPATHLSLTSGGWYSTVTTKDVSGVNMYGRETNQDTHETMKISKTAPVDTLDHDQPLNYQFVGTPRTGDEPNTTDYLYVIADYDDDRPFPFKSHHTTNFCFVRYPANTPGSSPNRSFSRSQIEDCLPSFTEFLAKDRANGSFKD